MQYAMYIEQKHKERKKGSNVIVYYYQETQFSKEDTHLW